MKERIDYYDVARGLGIIFVVIGHIDTFYMPLRQYVTSFHMALFFIISGMLIVENGEADKSLGILLKKKSIRIMLPYFFFSILAFVIESGRIILNGTFYLPHLKSLFLTTLTLYGTSVMWFLPALFFSQLLFLGIRKLFASICFGRKREADGGAWARKDRLADFLTIVAVITIVLCMIWYNILEQAFFAGHMGTERYKRIHEIAAMLIRSGFCTIFICVGYSVRKYLLARKIAASISGVLSILLLAVCLFIHSICPGVELRSMLWGKTDIWVVNYYTTEFIKAGMYIVGACSGALGIVLLCKALDKYRHRKIWKGLTFLGNNSLTIMATHLDFHVLHVGTIVAGFINIYAKSSFIYHVCVLLFVFAAEIALVLFVNRFLPAFVGKKQNKLFFHK